MNFKEIENAVNHIIKSCKCLSCKENYETDDINIIATTNREGLFEITCKKCHAAAIITVALVQDTKTKETKIKRTKMNRTHKEISTDEILDIKNFLSDFDGNFKKIFLNQ